MAESILDSPPARADGAPPCAGGSERLRSIATAFEAEFGAPPTVYARSPGRVNLIGEHVDYSGYGVLPMALVQDVVIALRTTDDGSLAMANADARFPPLRVAGGADVHIDASAHHWTNYVLAGYKGVLQEAGADVAPRGMQMLVSGLVPPGAGVSSSSALVVAAALATAAAHDVHMGRVELAALCARSERFVGTEGGGMDHAAQVLAARGVAKHIRFHPLRSADVHLPAGATFVIANSLVESNKQCTAATHYNLRVVECHMAAVLLARAAGVSQDGVRTLRHVHERVAARDGATMAEGLRTMRTLVAAHLHEAPYTRAELAGLVGVDEATLVAEHMTTRGGDRITAVDAYALRARAEHVFGESARVLEFVAACSAGRPLAELGELMNASHHSCDALFDCSCAELNALVRACREGGALGARLTGAGWGGCVVALVEAERVGAFVAHLHAAYYTPRALPTDAHTVFASPPSAGACIFHASAK